MDNNDIADFFSDTEVSIWHNQSLRVPQMEGYFAIREHFSVSEDSCYATASGRLRQDRTYGTIALWYR